MWGLESLLISLLSQQGSEYLIKQIFTACPRPRSSHYGAEAMLTLLLPSPLAAAENLLFLSIRART